MGFVEGNPGGKPAKSGDMGPQTRDQSASQAEGNGATASSRRTADELPEPRPYATKTPATVQLLKDKYKKKKRKRR